MVAETTHTATDPGAVVHPFTRMAAGASPDHVYSDAGNRQRGDEPGPKWLIEGLLPLGVSVVIADPGRGKSMVVQQICHHLVYGRPLGDWDAPAAGGLLAWQIDLEGDASMTRDRSYNITPYGELPGDRAGAARTDHWLWYSTWVIPPAQRAAYKETYRQQAVAHIQYVRDTLLEAAGTGHPIGLVVIDTLGKFMGPRPKHSNAYEWEAYVVGELNTMAVELGVAVIIIHHTNKAGEVSGSTGIAGSATVAWKLDATTDEDTNVTTGRVESLKVRNGPAFSYAVEQQDDGTWRFTDQLGALEAASVGHKRSILEALRERPRSRSELGYLGIGSSLGKVLDRMRKNGEIRLSFGRWTLTGDAPARPGPALPLCTVCGLEMRQAEQGQTTHPTCQPVDVEDQADDDAGELGDELARFDALKLMRESLGASRMKPVPTIRQCDREAPPWTLITERMTGEHRWALEALPLGERVVTLDRNGSYPSAAGSVLVAANLLAHTGELAERGATAGVYLVAPVAWTDERIGHPLGRLAEQDGPLWVTTPHLQQLEKLAGEKVIAPPVILDSWTGRPTGGLFTSYSKAVRAARDAATGEDYVNVKRRSSIALRLLWPKGDRITSPFWRPDWSVSIRAEAAVRHWRVAYNAVQLGATLVQLGSVDEAAFLDPAGDVPAPYELGASYGKVKIKDTVPAGDWTPRRRKGKP